MSEFAVGRINLYSFRLDGGRIDPGIPEPGYRRPASGNRPIFISFQGIPGGDPDPSVIMRRITRSRVAAQTRRQ